MKWSTFQPFAQPAGTYDTTDLVFYTYGNQLVSRTKARAENTPSEDRVRSNQCLAQAARQWQQLSPVQRHAWQAYADRYYSRVSGGSLQRATGQATFIRAASVRLILGLEAAWDAPVQAPPLRLRGIVQEPGAGPGTIALKLRHDHALCDGMLVLVRATPPTKTAACAPQANAYRYVCGLGSASTRPLSPDGGTIMFSPIRHELPAGRRYGVEARIMRADDAILSLPVYGDFIKG